MLKYNIKVFTAILMLLYTTSPFQAFSQFNMPSSRYFFNPYLANPSYAGLNQALKINASYQGNLNKIDNAPTNQYLTADMGINNKVGAGLTVNHVQVGLFTNTQISASYAYHLPLQSEDQKLNFGLSLGINANRITNNYIGESNDPLVQGDYYNNTSPDAGFGVSYTSETIDIQASAYRLVSSLRDDMHYNIGNNNAYYINASYKMGKQDFIFIPQIGYNSLRDMDNIFDIGTEINVFDKQFRLLGMYHSNNSFTWGGGFNSRSNLNVLMVYNTPPKNFRSYANQVFELALQYSFRKK